MADASLAPNSGAQPALRPKSCAAPALLVQVTQCTQIASHSMADMSRCVRTGQDGEYKIQAALIGGCPSAPPPQLGRAGSASDQKRSAVSSTLASILQFIISSSLSSFALLGPTQGWLACPQHASLAAQPDSPGSVLPTPHSHSALPGLARSATLCTTRWKRCRRSYSARSARWLRWRPDDA